MSMPLQSSMPDLSATVSGFSAPFLTLAEIPGVAENPEFANSFGDQVSFSDIISDPVLQVGFAVSALAIVGLFVAKKVVTEMDAAVGKVAKDFDKIMMLQYAKKWRKTMGDDFVDEAEELAFTFDEEREGNRIQKIVEAMEVFTNEEPEFMERVMLDVNRLQK